MFGLGMDIGYSNLKLAFGDLGEASPFATSMPAIAAPASTVANLLSAEAEEDGIRVMVNGVQWVAGLPPAAVHRQARELHDAYAGSDVWMALAGAGMLAACEDRIPLLVAGLPVGHYGSESQREKLVGLLQGTHVLTRKRTVVVERAMVIPQPIGAYLDAVEWFDDASLILEGRILVLDPGFFSVDWALIEEGRYVAQASGSSLSAMSRLIETASLSIATDHGGNPGVGRMEDAVRQGKETVRVYGETVELKPYLDAAARAVATQALTELRANLRGDSAAVDLVLLAGGGAALYAEAAKVVFPKSRVAYAEDPVLANARGFWYRAAGVEGK